MNKLNVLTNNSLENNNITFFVSDKEIIKLAADGSFYFKGKKVTEDIEVYNGFVTFLKEAGHYKK